jgi:hypothetical protein
MARTGVKIFRIARNDRAGVLPTLAIFVSQSFYRYSGERP